jgi:hypothetical protein
MPAKLAMSSPSSGIVPRCEKIVDLGLTGGNAGADWKGVIGDDSQNTAALSPCPSELGTHGAVDLPRSAAGLQTQHSLAGECDGDVKF